VIYAVRRKRKESVLKRAAYWSFYRLLAAISELDIPLDSGDFCVMDRQAVDLLNTLPECQRFIRGLRSWVGLKQIGVEYERDARQGADRPTPSKRWSSWPWMVWSASATCRWDLSPPGPAQRDRRCGAGGLCPDRLDI